MPGHRRDFRVGLKQAFKTIHDPQNILGNVDASEFGPGPFFGSRNRWQNCIRFRIGVTLGARVDAQRHFEPPLVDFQLQPQSSLQKNGTSMPWRGSSRSKYWQSALPYIPGLTISSSSPGSTGNLSVSMTTQLPEILSFFTISFSDVSRRESWSGIRNESSKTAGGVNFNSNDAPRISQQ